MKKKEFKKIFKENPIDVLGCDWKNDLSNMLNSVDKIIKSKNDKTKKTNK